MWRNTLIPLLHLVLPLEAYARYWKDVGAMHGLEAPDSFDIVSLASEFDPFGEREPNPSPIRSPTSGPTEVPPSKQNHSDPYPFNNPPSFPDPWYFNYDTRPDARYGPGTHTVVHANGSFQNGFMNNKWAETEVSPDYYWKEFTKEASGVWKGVLEDRSPSRNRCGRIGSQSPIDVRENGLGRCEEHHEVRSRPGDLILSSDQVFKEIHGNKLRLRFERRPCRHIQYTECQEPDPPTADFPHGWGGDTDALHADIKVPSEHLLNGRRYDAEFQVFHLHKDRKRTPVQATLIEVTKDGFNSYFDYALRAFDFEFQHNAVICTAKRRRSRQLVRDFQNLVGIEGDKGKSTDYESLGEYSLESDDPGFEERREKAKRELFSDVWDPHHPMLVPSIHFYRYEGSLTEPPCGEWVSWFVTDVTMKISFEQLEHLKKILFNHVDPNCKRTSIQYDQSVARPIQETGDRPVYRCTPKDFGPDK